MMKAYRSLMKKSPDQPVDEIFADFTNQPMDKPVSSSVPGVTDGPNAHTGSGINQHFPVITTYLDTIFLRAQNLKQILYSADGKLACFNTQLHTKEHKSIYVLFCKTRPTKLAERPDWEFSAFANGSL